MSTGLIYPDDKRVAAYVSNFRESLKAAGGTPIYDSKLPNGIMNDYLVPWNQARYFALLFPPGPVFSANMAGALVIDADGRAHEAGN